MRAGLLLLAALASVVPMLLPAYATYLANLLLMYAVLALGLDVLLGLAGQFAFAHMAFFGIGVYTTGILGNRLGISFPLPLLAGAALASATAIVIAIPALRLRQIYLALTTFAFASAAQWVFHSWNAVTEGSNGLRLSATRLLAWRLVDDRDAYPVLLVIAGIMLALRLSLQHSKLGRSMQAVHESEPAALASGIDAGRTRVIAFGLSGLFAGVAGGMLPLFNSYVHPDIFGLEGLVGLLTMVVIGGLGSSWGVLLGVLVIGLLPEVMRDLQVLREVVYGLVLILAVMFLPRGIAGAVRSARA
jgi:branched-chain amino acid transport system permease protein